MSRVLEIVRDSICDGEFCHTISQIFLISFGFTDAKSDNSQKVDSTTQQVNNQMIGNPDPIVAAAVA